MSGPQGASSLRVPPCPDSTWAKKTLGVAVHGLALAAFTFGFLPWFRYLPTSVYSMTCVLREFANFVVQAEPNPTSGKSQTVVQTFWAGTSKSVQTLRRKCDELLSDLQKSAAAAAGRAADAAVDRPVVAPDLVAMATFIATSCDSSMRHLTFQYGYTNEKVRYARMHMHCAALLLRIWKVSSALPPGNQQLWVSLASAQDTDITPFFLALLEAWLKEGMQTPPLPAVADRLRFENITVTPNAYIYREITP